MPLVRTLLLHGHVPVPNVLLLIREWVRLATAALEPSVVEMRWYWVVRVGTWRVVSRQALHFSLRRLCCRRPLEVSMHLHGTPTVAELPAAACPLPLQLRNCQVRPWQCSGPPTRLSLHHCLSPGAHQRLSGCGFACCIRRATKWWARLLKPSSSLRATSSHLSPTLLWRQGARVTLGDLDGIPMAIGCVYIRAESHAALLGDDLADQAMEGEEAQVPKRGTDAVSVFPLLCGVQLMVGVLGSAGKCARTVLDVELGLVASGRFHNRVPGTERWELSKDEIGFLLK